MKNMKFSLTSALDKLYPCHIFLVVRLHEQISDLTSFPSQGKATTPDFP